MNIYIYKYANTYPYLQKYIKICIHTYNNRNTRKIHIERETKTYRHTQKDKNTNTQKQISMYKNTQGHTQLNR